MSKEIKYVPIKFDLPEEYVRAVRVRAGFDNVNPRDIVMLALDKFLAKELGEVRQHLNATEKQSGDGKKGRPKT